MLQRSLEKRFDHVLFYCVTIDFELSGYYKRSVRLLILLDSGGFEEVILQVCFEHYNL